MINEKNKDKISYLYLDSVTKCIDSEKKIRCYGTDVEIYNSEIHIISAIAEHEGIHVSGLAELLKITKGSVSEMLKKLEKKGLVEKRNDPSNLSRLALYVTEKGAVAHKNHKKFHKKFNDTVEKIVDKYSENEKNAIKEFLILVSEEINKL